MRGRFAPQAEIARGRDQRAAEMVHPDPIDESPGRQRIRRGWRSPAPARDVPLPSSKRLPLGTGQHGEEPARSGFAQVVGIAADKNTRLDRRACVSSRLKARAGAPGPLVSHFCTASRSSCSLACEGRSGKRPRSPIGEHRDVGRAVRAVEDLPQRFQGRHRKGLGRSSVECRASLGVLPELFDVGQQPAVDGGSLGQ